MATLAELRDADRGDDEQITSLQAKLDEYWETFDPLFDWTPTEKILRSAGFLRREVVPRREAVLAIAQEIEELNNANLAAQRAEVARRHEAFRDDLHRLLWQTVLLGLVVALIVVFRLRVLERRSRQRDAADAERQMRQLSQQLVATQEEERKNLSRELHDHVAQVLTALRMELGRIERTSAARRARRRGGGRMQEAGRQHVPHRPRSGARPPAQHARRLRPAAGARMARARLHAAATASTSS